MSIVTISYSKFKSIQLQREESATKSTKLERYFYFVSVEAIDTAIYV